MHVPVYVRRRLRDHMKRIDPGDMEKGLTAEGSGRVATYLAHRLIHSYTLEVPLIQATI